MAPLPVHSRLSSWLSVLFGVVAVASGLAIAVFITEEASTLKLVVYVIGAAAGLLTFLYGEWGVVVLTAMTYTRFSDVAIKYHGAPSTAQPFLLLLIGTIAFRWIIQGRKPSGWGLAALLLVSYGLAGVAALFSAIDIPSANEAVADYFKDAAIALVVVMLAQRAKTLHWMVWALLGAGLFMGSLSVFQQLTGTFTENYGGFAQAPLKQIVGETDDYRISGPIGDPNFYGQIMLVLVPLALDRFWNETKPWKRGVALAAGIVCVLTVFFTFSRGAFVALVVVVGLIFARYRPHPAAILVTVAVAIPLMQFLPPKYWDRISTLTDAIPGLSNTTEESSFRGRTSEMLVAWDMFIDHPLVGVGLENYPAHYQVYSRQLGIDPRREDRSAHSLYLEIAAETGLLGLLTFGTMFGVMFVQMQRAQTKLADIGDKNTANLINALTIGLLGYLLAAIFLHSAYPRYLWLLYGIAMATPEIARQEVAIRRALTLARARQRNNQPT